MEPISGQMVEDMKVNGSATSYMEMALTLGLMAALTQVITSKTKRPAMVYISGQTVNVMKDNGTRESSMVRVPLSILGVKVVKVFGIMVSAPNGSLLPKKRVN